MIGESLEGKEGGEGEGADLDNFEDNVVLRSSLASKRHNKLRGRWLGIEAGLYSIGRRDTYLATSKVSSPRRSLISLRKRSIL